MKVECPFCKGKGFTNATQNNNIRRYSTAERKKAVEMRRKGYSYRAIGKALNISGSSAQKVKSMINAYINKLIKDGVYLKPEPKESIKYYKKLN